jgi:flagellar motor component MotA
MIDLQVHAFLDSATRITIATGAASLLAAMGIMGSVSGFIPFIGRTDRFEDANLRALVQRALHVSFLGAALFATAFISSILSELVISFLLDALTVSFLLLGVSAFLWMLHIIYEICLILVR